MGLISTSIRGRHHVRCGHHSYGAVCGLFIRDIVDTTTSHNINSFADIRHKRGTPSLQYRFRMIRARQLILVALLALGPPLADGHDNTDNFDPALPPPPQRLRRRKLLQQQQLQDEEQALLQRDGIVHSRLRRSVSDDVSNPSRNLQERCVFEGNFYGSLTGRSRNIVFRYQGVFAPGTSSAQVVSKILPLLEDDIVQGILPSFFDCPGIEPTGSVNGISPSDEDTLTSGGKCVLCI